MSSPPDEANPNPSGTVKTSATIYFSLLGAGILLFECVRSRFKHVYDIRSTDVDKFWPSLFSKTPFGWIPQVYRVSDDEIMDRCGLDTLSLLRLMRMGRKITLLVVGLSALLFPLYATGASTNAKRIDPLTLISMSNLPPNSNRLWASTMASCVVCAYTMHLLVAEYKVYVKRRHEILSKKDAPQYSVLVNDLPIRLRSRTTLQSYVEQIFPGSIHAVNPAIECAALEKMVTEREHIRQALEHELAKSKRYGISMRQHQSDSARVTRGKLINSINCYEDQLVQMNEKVAREIASLNFAQERLTEQVLTHEIEEVSQLLSTKQTPLLMQYQLDEPSVMSKVYYNDDNDSRHERTDSQAKRDRSRIQKPIRVMLGAAFVSFKSLKSAQIAQQTLQSKNLVSTAMYPAPHADDVKWENVGVKYRSRSIWILTSALITALIVLFWTIPTAFVASLASTDSLRRNLPFLNKAIEKYPILGDLLKQLAPLALVLLSALAPIIFRFLSSREGHTSTTEVRASLFTKLAYFQLIQIFFVTVIVGTVLDSLAEIIDQPKMLVAMLGRNMPQQAIFFVSYVIVLTGLGLVLELLRVVPALSSLIFWMCAPNLTRREREASWYGLSFITNAQAFDPTSLFADGFLVVLVSLTFATIAPLVCYFTGWYFFVAETVYRRQVFYVYKPIPYASGAFWPRLYGFIIIALVVSQLTLLGMLSLKNGSAQAIVIGILIIFILICHHQLQKIFPPAAKFLPLMDCVRLDAARSQQGITFDFLDNVYVQPAMRQAKPIHADFRMTACESDDDVYDYVESPEADAQLLV